MRLDIAIEHLEGLRQGLDMPLMTNENKALLLGMEALRRLGWLRNSQEQEVAKLLPTETKG